MKFISSIVADGADREGLIKGGEYYYVRADVDLEGGQYYLSPVIRASLSWNNEEREALMRSGLHVVRFQREPNPQLWSNQEVYDLLTHERPGISRGILLDFDGGALSFINQYGQFERIRLGGTDGGFREGGLLLPTGRQMGDLLSKVPQEVILPRDQFSLMDLVGENIRYARIFQSTPGRGELVAGEETREFDGWDDARKTMGEFGSRGFVISQDKQSLRVINLEAGTFDTLTLYRRGDYERTYAIARTGTSLLRPK